MKKRLLIVGAGEMGIQVCHYAQIDGKYEVIGFVDDTKKNESVSGLPILGNICDIEKLYFSNFFDTLFIAIGYKHLQFKKELFAKLVGKIPFANIIADPAYIDKTAIVGEGIMIYPGVIIDKNARIGNNTILNLGCVICHDTVVGESCFIGVRSAVSGFCKIGNCVFMGTSATVVDNISICDKVVVGASALVTKDIMIPGTYVGIPHKRIK